MHSMGNVIDMRRFSGLRHRLPWTFRTFTVGAWLFAACRRSRPFSARTRSFPASSSPRAAADVEIGRGWGAIYFLIYWTAVFTAFLTAFYTGRAFFKTFFGPEKLPSPDDPEADPSEKAAHGHGDHGHHEIGHESPPSMIIPLMALAICAIVVGLIFGPTGWFEHHIARTPGFESAAMKAEEHGTDWATMIFGTLVGIAGLALSWNLYGKRSDEPGPAGFPDSAALQSVASQVLGRSRFTSGSSSSPALALQVCVGVRQSGDRRRGEPRRPDAAAVRQRIPFAVQNGLVQFYAAAMILGLLVLIGTLISWRR